MTREEEIRRELGALELGNVDTRGELLRELNTITGGDPNASDARLLQQYYQGLVQQYHQQLAERELSNRTADTPGAGRNK